MNGRDSRESLLQQGLQALGVDPRQDDLERLLRYAELLRHWGRVYNLTAIDQPEDVIRLHLLDSVSIWTYVPGTRILDVGTGAGLPGIPLAVLLPQRQFDLLDRSAKKIRFVLQAAIELRLKNVRTVQTRVEGFEPDAKYDAILVRAFGSLGEIWRQTRRLLNERGVVLAMKGRSPGVEEELPSGAQRRVIPLRVPGLDAARHLVELTSSH